MNVEGRPKAALASLASRESFDAEQRLSPDSAARLYTAVVGAGGHPAEVRKLPRKR